MTITQAALLDMLEYRNGSLFWKKPNTNRLKAGDPAGCIETKGYRVVMVKGNKYKAHKLIYMMFHGILPDVIDHINGIKDDNRIANLRVATISENNTNCFARSNNTSGIKNVSWNKQSGKWQVSLAVEGAKRYFGMFKDKELAELVAYEAREKFHGKFANHGAIAA